MIVLASLEHKHLYIDCVQSLNICVYLTWPNLIHCVYLKERVILLERKDFTNHSLRSTCKNKNIEDIKVREWHPYTWFTPTRGYVHQELLISLLFYPSKRVTNLLCSHCNSLSFSSKTIYNRLRLSLYFIRGILRSKMGLLRKIIK